MKLLIAIPAYNEEQSIESIIDRSLLAKKAIVSSSGVSDVEITVVSDGSTDKTAELAKAFSPEINLIEFRKNRGYGAAIKAAWSQSDAELLGFLDADGTCDPTFFRPLCDAIERDHADVVLGCRLNEQSKMPLIRRFGNFVFATILSVLSSTKVRDTASGMRVVRRASISKLYPLPDGMHFTPAMSARALLDQSLKISEINMPYSEREGESKLAVGRDGLRFLRVILESSFLYRPSRPLGILAVATLLIAIGLMFSPTAYYLAHHSVAEWMIYRFVVSHLAGTTAALLLSASYLTGRMVSITLPGNLISKARGGWARVMNTHWFWALPLLCMLVGGILVIPSLLQLVRTGATYEHWSRFIAMSFLFSLASILVVTRAMDYVLSLVGDRLAYLESMHHS